jgi:hypothetical protein
MKIIKSHKKLKRLLILTAAYAVLSFIISISVIASINNSIVTQSGENISIVTIKEDVSNMTDITDSSSKTKDTENILENKLTDVPDSALDISFSYDGKYCVYLYNNKIYIKDIAANTTIYKISDGVSITNFILINDRNIIIYFTLNGTSLKVKTYDIVNNVETLQKTIKISAGATIKHVDYSTLTNLVLINIESGKSSNLINTMYYLNIMKRLKTFQLENAINNMILLNNTFTLYFEDKNNNLYCYPNPISGFNKKKVRLLGSDSNDNVFIESLDNKNTIYFVKNEKIDKTINLNDPAYMEIYTNKIGVYVVYSNYIINLAGDIDKKMLIDKNFKFIGIGGNKIYFRDSNGYIISKNNSI